MTTQITFTNDSTTPINITSVDLSHRFQVNRVDLVIDRIFSNKYESYVYYHDKSFQSEGINSLIDHCNNIAINNSSTFSAAARVIFENRVNSGLSVGFIPTSNDIKSYIGGHRLTPHTIYNFVIGNDIQVNQWYAVPYRDYTLDQGAANLYHVNNAHANMMWYYSFITLVGTGTYNAYPGTGATDVIQHGVRFLTNYRSQSLKILIYQTATKDYGSGLKYNMCEHIDRDDNLVKSLRDAGHEVSFNTYNFELGEELSQHAAWQYDSDKKTTAIDHPFDYLNTFDVIIYGQLAYKNAFGEPAGDVDNNYFTPGTLDAFTRFARDPNKGFMFIFDHDQFAHSVQYICQHWYDLNILDKKLEFYGQITSHVNYTDSDASTVFDTDFSSDLAGTSSCLIRGWKYPETVLWPGNTSEHQFVSNNRIVVKEKRNEFVNPIQARYMRLYPIYSKDAQSLSLEFYDGDTALARGLSDSHWSSQHVSSRWPVVHGPPRASYRYQGHNDVYTGRHRVPLEVDLGSVKQVTAIGTLPRNSITYQQRVEAYWVGFSVDGNEWSLLGTNGDVYADSQDGLYADVPLLNVNDMPEDSRVIVAGPTIDNEATNIVSMLPLTLVSTDQPLVFDNSNLNINVPAGDVPLVDSTGLVYAPRYVSTTGVYVNDVNMLGRYNPYLNDQFKLDTYRSNNSIGFPNKMLPGSVINIEIDSTVIIIPDQGSHDSVNSTPMLSVNYECPLGTENIANKQVPIDFRFGNKLCASEPAIYMCWAGDKWPEATYIRLDRKTEGGKHFVSQGDSYESTGGQQFNNFTGRWQLQPVECSDGEYVWCLQFNPTGRDKTINIVYYQPVHESFINEYSYYTPEDIHSSSKWITSRDGRLKINNGYRAVELAELVDNDNNPKEFLFMFHEPTDTVTGQAATRTQVVKDILAVHDLNYDPDGQTLLVKLVLDVDRDRDLVYEIIYTHTNGENYKYIISDQIHLDTIYFRIFLKSQITSTVSHQELNDRQDDFILSYENRIKVRTRSLRYGGKYGDDYSAYTETWCDLKRFFTYVQSPMYHDEESFGKWHWDAHGNKLEFRGDLPTTYKGYTSQEQHATVPPVFIQTDRESRTAEVKWIPVDKSNPNAEQCTDVRLVDSVNNDAPEGEYSMQGARKLTVSLENESTSYLRSKTLNPGESYTFRDVPIETTDTILTTIFGNNFQRSIDLSSYM